jgi:hypothetical protein
MRRANSMSMCRMVAVFVMCTIGPPTNCGMFRLESVVNKRKFDIKSMTVRHLTINYMCCQVCPQ